MEQRGGQEVEKGSKMEPDGAKRSKMEAREATEAMLEASDARPGGRRGGSGRQF